MNDVLQNVIIHPDIFMLVAVDILQVAVDMTRWVTYHDFIEEYGQVGQCFVDECAR